MKSYFSFNTPHSLIVLVFRSDRTSRTGVVCVSVCLSEVLVENVHWGPLDDSRMGNWEWGLGNGEWGLGIGDWGLRIED